MIQVVTFNKEYGWDTTRCRRWLSKHKLYPIKRVNEQARYYRYRTREPNYDKYEYKTKKLGNGLKKIFLVIQYIK